MKLYRNAIILLVIVVLLVGAYFLVKSRKSDDPLIEPGKYEKLTDYTTDQIESVTLENKDGTFVIVKGEEDWELSAPSDLRYDPSALSSIVINSASIVADKVIEENAADLSIYGLDDPAVARIKAKDGATVSIEIGNKTPTASGYYVKLEGKNKVYVIANYTGDKLVTGRNGMRKKQLFETTPEKIQTLAMNRKGANVFASEKDKEGSNWSMTAPIRGSVNESAFSPMLEALANATILEFIEDKPGDLSKYGLDKPAYEFVFSAEGMDEVKLQMGIEKSKGTSIYARLDGSDEVFTLDMSPFTFLDKPLKEIVNIFAYIVNIDQVRKIDLTMDGKTTNMTLDVYKDAEGKPDTDKDKFFVNGIDASGKDENDDQPFRKFYQALIGVCIDEIDLDGKPEGKAEITIEYTLEDGSMKVEYIPKDENFYYVVRNGEYAGVLVKKRNKVDFGIDGMKQAYAAMMDFLAQQGK